MKAGSRLAAAAVHSLTASGAAAGFLALVATAHDAFRAALLCMAYSLAVDSVDGTLARAARAREVLPGVDGSRLDDIVDYLTYVIVPAFLLYRAPILPPAAALPIALAVVLASAYGFARTDAKTTDNFFTGFPSYWNVLAFYLYVLAWPPWLNAALVVGFTVLVFVPTRYVYPSRTVPLRRLTVALGTLWGVAVLWLIAAGPRAPRLLALVSLLFPAYYLGLSLALGRRRARAC